MGFTFAIADLHGRRDLLDAVLEVVESYVGSGKVVFTGDYVDRGPESAQVIERLRAGPPNGWEWVCLQGNHERMMIDCCHAREDIRWWIGNGGDTTLISYGFGEEGRYANALDCAQLRSDLLWADSLPLLHDDGKRVFVHAGLNHNLPLDKQDPQLAQWTLNLAPEDGCYPDRHVVHGHHQFADGPKLFPNRTNMDTLAWHEGRVHIGVFDDDKDGGPTCVLTAFPTPTERGAS